MLILKETEKSVSFFCNQCNHFIFWEVFPVERQKAGFQLPQEEMERREKHYEKENIWKKNSGS